MIIYKATNTINGKSYIGQTTLSLAQRKAVHISLAKSNKTNTSFARALKKHQPENFIWSILHKCNTLEECNIFETEYIKQYNTVEEGYNTNSKGSNTGPLGLKLSEERKQQISETNKGNNIGNQYAKGYEFSEETKQKRIGNQYAKGKPVVINDQYFKTIQAAADFTNITRATLVARINNKIEGHRFV